MAEISGAQLVVDSLKREGVDTIYTLPGDPVGPIVNGCAEAGMRLLLLPGVGVCVLGILQDRLVDLALIGCGEVGSVCVRRR